MHSKSRLLSWQVISLLQPEQLALGFELVRVNSVQAGQLEFNSESELKSEEHL